MRGGGGGWWSHREVGCSLLVPMVKDEAKGMIQGFKDSGIDSGIFLVPLSSLVLGSKAHRVAKTSTMGLHSGHAAAVLGSSSRQKAASLSGMLRTLHPVSLGPLRTAHQLQVWDRQTPRKGHPASTQASPTHRSCSLLICITCPRHTHTHTDTQGCQS